MFDCMVAAAIGLSWWRDRRVRAGVFAVIILCAGRDALHGDAAGMDRGAAGIVVAMLADRRLRGWLPFVAAGAAIVVPSRWLSSPGSPAASATGPRRRARSGTA